MGNSLLRENNFRWHQNAQELPWNPRNQSHQQRTSRRWDCHFAEGCFCLPWKKMRIFKARQDSPKQSKTATSLGLEVMALYEETSSALTQENAYRSSSEDLCYASINHSVAGRRPTGNLAEECYENVSLMAERPRESLGGTETEYSLLCVPATPRHPSSPEDQYELLMPSRIFPRSVQQPHSLTSPSQAPFSHL
ncbi:germinal center-associated signaling and motility protein isoform X2 [Vicugna pacos]|uniref:Germinal center-associated signaling and motility protein isoform X2 n=1 Tax=Vicugna pacos TaxID=30538 RepID=A0A6J0B1U5_VICPA|nr:germinal center-associated signaling and motility protein isoform X2 [Vicugna pacos]